MQDATKLANHPACRDVPAERGAEWTPRAVWLVEHTTEDGRDVPVPLEQALAARTAKADQAIEAYANHGRWVVECPDCHGAQLACRTDARFLCNECGNVAIGGLWRPVTWPGDLEEIEAELHRRPLRQNRNWIPDREG